MKNYKIGSAAYRRQKETQRYQRIAAARPKPERDMHGRKRIHPKMINGWIRMDELMKEQEAEE